LSPEGKEKLYTILHQRYLSLKELTVILRTHHMTPTDLAIFSSARCDLIGTNPIEIFIAFSILESYGFRNKDC
jgi:hypothetical protein